MTVLKMKVGAEWIPVGGTPETVWTGPSAPTDPTIDLWIDTDEPALAGGGWPGPFTPLDQSAWTWVNQRTSVLTQGSGIVYLSASPAASDQTSGRVRAAPPTPYTITAFIVPEVIATANSKFGIGWQDGTGKLSYIAFSGAGDIAHARFPSPTSWAGAVSEGSYTWRHQANAWLRIADNGTNLTTSVSMDGVNFRLLSSVSRTGFMTAGPTLVGFFAVPASAAVGAGGSILSWVIT